MLGVVFTPTDQGTESNIIKEDMEFVELCRDRLAEQLESEDG